MVSAVGISPRVPGAAPHKGADAARPAGRRLAAGELTEEQQAQVQKLKQIDQKVRTHELAHLGAGAGVVAGGPSFTYTRGPDGQQYAIAGEVPIQSPGVPGDPEATLRRAEQVAAAALAPADASTQDRAVAANATKIAAEARMQLMMEKLSGVEGQGGTDGGSARATSPGVAAYQRQASRGTQATPSPRPVDVRA